MEPVAVKKQPKAPSAAAVSAKSTAAKAKKAAPAPELPAPSIPKLKTAPVKEAAAVPSRAAPQTTPSTSAAAAVKKAAPPAVNPTGPGPASFLSSLFAWILSIFGLIPFLQSVVAEPKAKKDNAKTVKKPTTPLAPAPAPAPAPATAPAPVRAPAPAASEPKAKPAPTATTNPSAEPKKKAADQETVVAPAVVVAAKQKSAIEATKQDADVVLTAPLPKALQAAPPAAPPPPKPSPPPAWAVIGSDPAWAQALEGSWRLVAPDDAAHSEHLTKIVQQREGAATWLTSGWDGKVSVWTLDEGTGALTLEQALAGHSSRVEVIEPLPGTDLVLTAGRDAQMFLWRVPLHDPSKATRISRTYLYEQVRCGALVPAAAAETTGEAEAEQTVLLGTTSGLILTIRVDLQGKPEPTARVAKKSSRVIEGDVTALAVTSGPRVVAAGAGTVTVWKMGTGHGLEEEVGEVQGTDKVRGQVLRMATCGPASSHVLLGDISSSVKILDVSALALSESGVVLAEDGAVCPLAGLAFDAARKILVVSGAAWVAPDSFEEAPMSQEEACACINVLAFGGKSELGPSSLYALNLGDQRGLVTAVALAKNGILVGTTSGSLVVLRFFASAGKAQGGGGEATAVENAAVPLARRKMEMLEMEHGESDDSDIDSD